MNNMITSVLYSVIIFSVAFIIFYMLKNIIYKNKEKVINAQI